ncbi:unnamed protein product [Adineta ricciae]|uniref:Uncharacterized protein n=1 Tax=Adineta ricciae TaxID=249248 RepID=A0A814VS05_ADIRI|nr:unnamed protein product [Adineta ricciae]
MFLLLAINFLVHIVIHFSNATPCSDLDLSGSNKNTDGNYTIQFERTRSSNIIKVKLERKQTPSNISWFLMGASDSTRLLGLWHPFTPTDGQVIHCSTSLEQAVTNEDSFMLSTNQSEYTFFWMHSNSLNKSIIFIATIFYSNDRTTMGHIQSSSIEMEQKQERERYQYSTDFCDSSPCQNNGTCVRNGPNSYCQCSFDIIGANCDQLSQCNDMNCLNNGTCVVLSAGSYQCNCAPGYGGIYCHYNITGCVFPFIDNEYQSQNSCITSNDYMNGTVPWCKSASGRPNSCQNMALVFHLYDMHLEFCFQHSLVRVTLALLEDCVHTNWSLAYFRAKARFKAPGMSKTTLNALESSTTQTYQNLTNLFQGLIRNQTNSSFDFSPLMYTTFSTYTGNFIQITADMSFAGNITQRQIYDIIQPILANLPPYFNLVYDNTSLTDISDFLPLNAAPYCTLPHGYYTKQSSVCHVAIDGNAYCAYGQNYTVADRRMCDSTGLPTQQHTACETLNMINPCNSTPDFPIHCLPSDTNWTCFCELTQILGRNCRTQYLCQSGSTLCQNQGTCVYQADIEDFICLCPPAYYGRQCESYYFTNSTYRIYLLNYNSNESTLNNQLLISYMNETIMDMTNSRAFASNITIRPSGEVTIFVTTINYSLRDFDTVLTNKVNSNWSIGQYQASFNDTSLLLESGNMSYCSFPFTYKGVNYTTCTTVDVGSPWCSGTSTFSGIILDCRKIDWCASSPCLNGGICSRYDNGTVNCNCSACYTGPFCQSIDFCCLNVCSPHGACLSGLNNTYTCLCQPSYSGVNCSIYEPCRISPCQNQGTCVSTPDGRYTCTCKAQWTGVDCAMLVNPCASSPCLNNAACAAVGTQLTCICPPGRTGRYCEMTSQTPQKPNVVCNKTDTAVEFTLSSSSHSAWNSVSYCSLQQCRSNINNDNITCVLSPKPCFDYRTPNNASYCAPGISCSILEPCNNTAYRCTSSTSICITNSCCSPRAVCLPLLWTSFC